MKYPDSHYKPFSSTFLAFILIVGFVGLALQKCGNCLGKF